MRYPKLQIMIDHLRHLDNTPDSELGFDMAEVYCCRSHTHHPCGAACCIGGHANAILLRDKHIDSEVPTRNAMLKLCGLPDHVAEELCFPGVELREVTLEDALTVLENLRDTGKVEWEGYVVKMMSKAYKRVVEEKAATCLKQILPPRIPHHMACYYHAVAMQHAISMPHLGDGIRAIIQAGSASFLAVPDELDDGVSPTHYSYVYTEGSLQLLHDEMMLPEIHCWVVLHSAVENRYYIVDSTTVHLPELSESIGLKWQSPTPPNCLWSPVDELPKGWLYEPDREATLAINMFAQLTKGMLLCHR